MDWIPIAWVIVGVVLIISEVIVTSVIAVFFGVAAIVTGCAIASDMLPAEGADPWVLFSILSVAQLVFLRRRFAEWFRGRELSGPTEGIESDFVGRDARVIDGFGPDDHGRGRVDYRGAAWSAKGPASLSPGELVVISGRDNLTLIVERQED